MREITEHELNLITGLAEPSEAELANYGFDSAAWNVRLRKAFTKAMSAAPEDRPTCALEWSECEEERAQARIQAHRACTKAIWARIARGEIRDPFPQVRRFRGPLGRG